MFLLGAALAGGALGFTADRVMGGSRDCAKDPRAMRERLAEELELTTAQRAAFDSILDERHRQLVEVMKPVRPQMDSIRLNFRGQLMKKLDTEQQERFLALVAEMEKARGK